MTIVIKTDLHLAFDQLSKAVIAKIMHTTRFKTQLKRLQNTLIRIQTFFYKGSRLTQELLDRPLKETLTFISYLKKGKHLVLKTLRVNANCNVYQKYLHSRKLVRLTNKIVRFFQVALQVKTVNIKSTNYSLPMYPKGMRQLKVLNLTSYNDYPSKLHNLSSIGCLSHLKSIRFEHVSIPSVQSVFALKNLKELSFVMCEIGDAFMRYTTDQSPYILTNLTSLEIDMCFDLKELPSGLCNLVYLEKLSITNCHELDALPKGLGELSNLETLKLHCCTKLQGLPKSIGILRKLNHIDISDCLSMSELPEELGELCGLKVLKMNGCGGLQELPMSISELLQLEQVICDEETSYLWIDFESDLQSLKINIVEDDPLESFMKIVG